MNKPNDGFGYKIKMTQKMQKISRNSMTSWRIQIKHKQLRVLPVLQVNTVLIFSILCEKQFEKVWQNGLNLLLYWDSDSTVFIQVIADSWCNWILLSSFHLKFDCLKKSVFVFFLSRLDLGLTDLFCWCILWGEVIRFFISTLGDGRVTVRLWETFPLAL